MQQDYLFDFMLTMCIALVLLLHAELYTAEQVRLESFLSHVNSHHHWQHCYTCFHFPAVICLFGALVLGLLFSI